MKKGQIAGATADDESISALNYCAHAIEDLKRLNAHTQPDFVQSKRSVSAVIDLLQASVKFTGVYKATYRRYLADLGWCWVPTMQIGTGCTTHLRSDELPSSGRLIVCVSRHMTAVIDGVIRDTHDPSRDGTRCVYGYFRME